MQNQSNEAIEQYFNSIISGEVIAADIDLSDLQGWGIIAQSTGNKTLTEKSLVATLMVVDAKKHRFIEELKTQG